MLVVAALAANLFLAGFGGTWLCAGVRLTIAPAPSGPWTIVRREGEIAYVGYLAPAGGWIYDGFRRDGAFASATSPGPQNGTWTWSATYTTSARVTHGSFQWRRDGALLRQRTGRLLGTTFVPSGVTTVCRPAL